jgi:hypothetical protein
MPRRLVANVTLNRCTTDPVSEPEVFWHRHAFGDVYDRLQHLAICAHAVDYERSTIWRARIAAVCDVVDEISEQRLDIAATPRSVCPLEDHARSMLVYFH